MTNKEAKEIMYKFGKDHYLSYIYPDMDCLTGFSREYDPFNSWQWRSILCMDEDGCYINSLHPIDRSRLPNNLDLMGLLKPIHPYWREYLTKYRAEVLHYGEILKLFRREIPVHYVDEEA